jgi:hypothetical protein
VAGHPAAPLALTEVAGPDRNKNTIPGTDGDDLGAGNV